MSKKTIAIDFDGVIHKYSHGYTNGYIYDEPVHGALEAIARFQYLKYEVIIYTARDIDDSIIEKIVEWIECWTKIKGINLDFIKITNEKPKATIYIDDRGYRFKDWDTDYDEIIKLIE